MVPIYDVLGVILVIAGVFLFAIEIVHPGALLLIPASIVIAAGLLFLFLPDVLVGSVLGPVIVVVAALVAALATIPYYRWVAPVHRPMSTIPSSLEGEVGVVIAPVIPDTLKGKVRVNSEIWSARAEIPIPAGTRVRILGGEGVSIRVVPLVDGGGRAPP